MGNGDCPGSRYSEGASSQFASKWELRVGGKRAPAAPKQTCPMSWCPAVFCHQEGHQEFPPTSAKPLSPQNFCDTLPASSALGRGMSWEFWGLTGHTGLAPKHESTTLECCATHCPASCQGQGLPSLPWTTESSCGRGRFCGICHSLSCSLPEGCYSCWQENVLVHSWPHHLHWTKASISILTPPHSHFLSMQLQVCPWLAMQSPKNQLSGNSNTGTKEREGGGAEGRRICWNRRNRLWHLRDRVGLK